MTQSLCEKTGDKPFASSPFPSGKIPIKWFAYKPCQQKLNQLWRSRFHPKQSPSWGMEHESRDVPSLTFKIPLKLFSSPMLCGKDTGLCLSCLSSGVRAGVTGMGNNCLRL